MAEVLVLVDHVDGAVRKTTLELLTLARQLGEPAAVYFGETGETATAALAEYGAVKVYVVDAPEVGEYFVTPKVDALSQIAASAVLAGILVSSSSEGKEIAARTALRLHGPRSGRHHHTERLLRILRRARQGDSRGTGCGSEAELGDP
jgi:electron transfer flavoprotein alpha subunit